MFYPLAAATWDNEEVEAIHRRIVVVDFAAFPPVRRAAAGSARIASTVLPALDASAGAVFA